MIFTSEDIQAEVDKIESLYDWRDWQDSQEDLVAQLYLQVLESIAYGYCDPQVCAEAVLRMSKAYESK